tara:strand:+ start:783 stop:1277 length:495 start_codon:yes stop_codon:yes gene_type:complete
MTQVKVVAMQDGSVVKQSSNPEFGFIRVTQETVSIVNGWIRKNSRSALINGGYTDLMSMGLRAGSTFAGKLVIDEALEPFNPGPYEDRDIKFAFEGGPMCVFEDMPIYRRTRYTENVNELDTLIQHTNVDEIRNAVAERKQVAQVVENTANVEVKAEATLEEVF